jgi:hypothetical protein
MSYAIIVTLKDYTMENQNKKYTQKEEKVRMEDYHKEKTRNTTSETLASSIATNVLTDRKSRNRKLIDDMLTHALELNKSESLSAKERGELICLCLFRIQSHVNAARKLEGLSSFGQIGTSR